MMPEKISDINTNLSEADLIEVVAAIENEEVVWEESSLYVADRIGFFTYDDKKYRLFEYFECVISINII
jgi:hypothetical protein